MIHRNFPNIMMAIAVAFFALSAISGNGSALTHGLICASLSIIVDEVRRKK